MARGKKATGTPSEPVDEPWELPGGWRWKRLHEVTCEPDRGSPDQRFAGTFQYLDVSGIAGSAMSPKAIAVSEAPSRARQFVQAGDTVLSGVRVYLRNLALINQEGPNVASTAFCVLRPKAGVDPGYLFRWIGSDPFINALLPLQRGNSPPAVLDGDVRSQLIPLPATLEDQRNIVARIDALFADIDEGERALAAAREGVQTYRKSLLKAAVTGELTADWRRTNPPTETGEDLLRCILVERCNAWTAAPKNRGKKYVEPKGPEFGGLIELPAGWAWARLEQICWDGPTNGYSPRSSKTFAGTKALKLTATSGGAMRLDEDCIKTLGELIEPGSDLFLMPGDLLFQRGNTRELVGIAAVYDGPAEAFVYPDLMIRVRAVTPLLGEWAWRWANSPHGRAFMMERAQGAAGSMPKISGATVRDMPVPIGPPDELREALCRVEGQSYVSGWADGLPIGASASLRQSILAAAFRGDLIS